MSLFRTIIQALVTGILMSMLVTIYWSEDWYGVPKDPLEVIALALSLMGRREK